MFMTTKIPAVEMITKAIYYILPNLEKFNIRNEVIHGGLPSLVMLIVAILYAFTYAILLLVITQTAFKNKDY